MNAMLANDPPPLPIVSTTAKLPPLPPQAPQVGRSIGVIAIYFALQIVAGFGFALIVGIGAGFVLGVRGYAWASIKPQVRALLAQPNMQAALIMLTLVVAGLWTIWWARKSWPHLWSLAPPPGFGFVAPTSPAFFTVAAIAGIAVPIIGGLMTKLFAGSHPVTQDIQQLGTHTVLALRIPLTLLVVTLGPLVEELLFRGLLLSALMRRMHVVAAVAISSLAFVAMHLPGLQMQWFALPELLLLALVLAALRLSSRSIWPSVLTHGINNALAVLVWFVAIKPPG